MEHMDQNSRFTIKQVREAYNDGRLAGAAEERSVIVEICQVLAMSSKDEETRRLLSDLVRVLVSRNIL